MSEPVVLDVHTEDSGRRVAEIGYEGRVYKFARNEEGKVRCFWWEGSSDKSTFNYLNPFAVTALGGQASAVREPQREQHEIHAPRTSRHGIYTPSGPSCIHCGYVFPLGAQAGDVCPNCGENPFE